MIEKDKQLLLVDLCGRLLYKPKALVNGHLATILGIDENVVIVCIDGNDYKDETVVSADNNSDDVKPYLRPMSSMTEKEKHELLRFGVVNLDMDNNAIDVCCVGFENHAKVQDYLNSIHVDYRGLFETGLAIEITEENYPYEN